MEESERLRKLQNCDEVMKSQIDQNISIKAYTDTIQANVPKTNHYKRLLVNAY